MYDDCFYDVIYYQDGGRSYPRWLVILRFAFDVVIGMTQGHLV